jgi:hypothetical protein
LDRDTPVSRTLTDTLLKIQEVKQKLKYLVTARGHKENQKQKQSGCLPQSAFFKAI